MKLSRILTDYLIQHKRLNLYGLGYLTFDGTAIIPDEKNNNGLPNISGNVVFHPDKKTALDDDLITFISKETGKIKPLASSDLESYLELGKQLINISKPFVLEGIGALQKNGQNELEFVQGNALQGQVDAQNKKTLKSADEDVHFDDNYLKPVKNNAPSARSLAIIMLILAGLAIIGWVAYYFYNQLSLETTEKTVVPITENRIEQTMPVVDTQNIAIKPDTNASFVTLKDSLPITPTQAVQGTGFKLVLEISGHNRAMKRYADLKEWGHKVQMSTTDSVQYKIYIPVDAPVSDTVRHRDSLSRFFGRKVWVETN